MNDDAAEKASRRKSAHFGDLAVGRKESEAEKGGNAGKRVASGAGAMAVQNTNARDKVRKRLSAVGVAPGLPAPVALEVNSSKFEEWMKLATDNVRIKSITRL
jgi:condensin complex subunit 2